MKTLINDAMMAISAIRELEWVDDNLGQLNQEKPTVKYPCALVGIGTTNRLEYNGTGQYGDITLEITVANSIPVEENPTTLPEKIHPLAESIYDLLQKIDKAIYKLEGELYGPLTRIGIQSDTTCYPAKFILSYSTVLYE